MSLAAPDLFPTHLAVIAGGIFFLAPGYLLATATGFLQFRRRSWPEQLLWSLALSTPLSLVLAQLLGRSLPAKVTLGCFILLACAALITFLRSRPTPMPADAEDRRSLYIALGIALALAILFPLATNDIQINHRLFQSTVVYDWAVRVPLIRAAIQGGVPPLNPLSALNDGHASPLHYYYFWYVLVAQVCRLAHVDARAGLAASTVWAAFDLLAVVFLSLKHFDVIRRRLPSRCLLAMLIACVMGLDLIPALVMLLSPGIGLNLEMEWWHPDRSPSWLSTTLYAPHHLAGIACCILGFLAIVSIGEQANPDSGKRLPRWLLHALIAGICFAAAAGTSTFVTLIFACVCLLWAVRSVLYRDWLTLAALAVAALLSVGLDYSFLREMTVTGSSASISAAHKAATHAEPLVHLALRNNAFVAFTFAKHNVVQRAPLLNLLLRIPAILLLLFAELGFFTLIFLHKLRRDLRQRRTLSVYQQSLWAVFCGAGLVALFLSSGTDGPNDLGMHAGMVLKFVLLLWATQWVDEFYSRRATFRAMPALHKAVLLAACAAFVVGLAGSLYQLILERTLFPLQETGILNKRMDTYPLANLSYRLYNVQDAYRHINSALPSQSSILFNPDSALQPALGLYATRQMVAADPKCGTPFGGDPQRCATLLPSLRSFFGTKSSTSSEEAVSAQATAPTLQDLCRHLKMGAVLLTSADPIWRDDANPLWHLQPVYSNESVRVIGCNSVGTP